MNSRKHVKKVDCSCGNCGKIINLLPDVDDFSIEDDLPPGVEPYEQDYE